MAPVRIGEGVGIMGELYRVGLSYADGGTGPESVVVKLPSRFEENRAQGVALGMFEAEVRFYDELAPEIPVGLPKIFASAVHPGSAEFVIVMEDLSELTMVDQSAGMNAEQAMAAVTVAAQFHAVWWDRAKDASLEWIPSMTGARIEMVDQLVPTLVPNFLELFGDKLPDGGVEVYQGFAGNYLKLNQLIAARSPWTLAHQDYRVENLLFGPPGSGEVVVLDWQGMGRGPGAYDLAYVLSGSMDPQVRRDNEDALLKGYHDALTGAGVTGYSLDQLTDDYGHAMLMGGLATAVVVGGGMDLSNERGMQLGTTMAVRHVTGALDHDGLSRLAALSP